MTCTECGGTFEYPDRVEETWANASEEEHTEIRRRCPLCRHEPNPVDEQALEAAGFRRRASRSLERGPG